MYGKQCGKGGRGWGKRTGGTGNPVAGSLYKGALCTLKTVSEMVPVVFLPFDILKPGIQTTPFHSRPAFLYGNGECQCHGGWLWQCPVAKGETGPAFLSINEQVCYCLFLKHKMEIPGTYLSLRF